LNATFIVFSSPLHRGSLDSIRRPEASILIEVGGEIFQTVSRFVADSPVIRFRS
jgi:hypothetical protein